MIYYIFFRYFKKNDFIDISFSFIYFIYTYKLNSFTFFKCRIYFFIKKRCTSLEFINKIKKYLTFKNRKFFITKRLYGFHYQKQKKIQFKIVKS